MKLILTIALAIASNILLAQDSLTMLLNEEAIVQTKAKKYEPAFNGTQLVNSLTPETLHKYQLAFGVGHKFGDVGGDFGSENSFFGLENSTDVRISFDYGINDQLTVGVSRARELQLSGNYMSLVLSTNYCNNQKIGTFLLPLQLPVAANNTTYS